MAEDRPEGFAADARVPTYYTNSVGFQAGSIDVRLNFGYQLAQEPREPLVQLAMSWEEALILRDFLAEAIENYERNVGQVRDLGARLIPAEEQEEEEVSSGGDVRS